MTVMCMGCSDQMIRASSRLGGEGARTWTWPLLGMSHTNEGRAGTVQCRHGQHQFSLLVCFNPDLPAGCNGRTGEPHGTATRPPVTPIAYGGV
jgi:hypothetical protein